jgi:hypothetical protein
MRLPPDRVQVGGNCRQKAVFSQNHATGSCVGSRVKNCNYPLLAVASRSIGNCFLSVAHVPGLLAICDASGVVLWILIQDRLIVGAFTGSD